MSYKKAYAGGVEYVLASQRPSEFIELPPGAEYPPPRRGADDYYTSGEGKEPPGVWYRGRDGQDGHGERSETFGAIDGRVFSEETNDAEIFAQLAQGFDPDSGRALVQNPGHPRRVNFHDFTFSAPKSVSVVWGLAGDQKLREAIQRAGIEAARAGLDVFSRHSFARTGAQGKGAPEHAPLIAAIFEHGSARPVEQPGGAEPLIDPQLHFHSCVLNLIQSPDGKTRALETKELVRWKGTAASMNHAALAWGLRQLGFRIERKGSLFEIAGVPHAVCEHFSQRRQQLVKAAEADARAWAEEHGIDPATVNINDRALLQKATLETRAAKEIPFRGELEQIWLRRGAELGFTTEEVRKLRAGEHRTQLRRAVEARLHETGLDGAAAADALRLQHAKLQRPAVERARVEALWREEGTRLGFSDDEVDALLLAHWRSELESRIETALIQRKWDADAIASLRQVMDGSLAGERAPMQREQLVELWRHVGAQCGLAPAEIDEILAAQVVDDDEVRELTREELLEEAYRAVAELTETEAVFTEPALHTQLAVYLVGRASPEQIDQAVQDLMADVPTLTEHVGRQLIMSERVELDRFGEPLVDEHGEPMTRTYMTTLAMHLTEVQMLRDADRRDGAHVLRDLAEPEGLKPEQLAAWRRAVTDVNSVTVVEGTAGAGKTFTMAQVARSYESRGYTVTGLASSWSAALNLQADARLDDGRAITGWLAGVHAGRIQLGPKSLIILDEAGTVGARDMARVLAAAKKAGAKVVLLGDTLQQHAVAAGDPLRLIAKQNQSSKLTEIIRQAREEDRQAVAQFFAGHAKEALEAYRGRIHLAIGEEATHAAMVHAWAQSRQQHGGKSHLMIAIANRSVHELNRLAHAQRKEAGELGAGIAVNALGAEPDKPIELSVGDVVAFRVNQRELGQQDELLVTNRTQGVIERVEGRHLWIRTGAGKLLDVDVDDEKWHKDGQLGLQHGYATSVYASQGLTVDYALVLDSNRIARTQAGVAMSRHRHDCQVFVDRQARWEAKMLHLDDPDKWHPIEDFSEDECIARMAKSWSAEDVKDSTLDFAEWRRSTGSVVNVDAELRIKRLAAARQVARGEIERIREESRLAPRQAAPKPAEAKDSAIEEAPKVSARARRFAAGADEAEATAVQKPAAPKLTARAQKYGARPEQASQRKATDEAGAEHILNAPDPRDPKSPVPRDVYVVASAQKAAQIADWQRKSKVPASTIVVTRGDPTVLDRPQVKAVLDGAKRVHRWDEQQPQRHKVEPALSAAERRELARSSFPEKREQRAQEQKAEGGKEQAVSQEAAQRAAEEARKRAEEEARRQQQARVR